MNTKTEKISRFFQRFSYEVIPVRGKLKPGKLYCAFSTYQVWLNVMYLDSNKIGISTYLKFLTLKNKIIYMVETDFQLFVSNKKINDALKMCGLTNENS